MPLLFENQYVFNVDCDAMVNPFSYKKVDADILGPTFSNILNCYNSLSESEAKVSHGYTLPCEFVINARDPKWQGGQSGEIALLRSCYINALIAAVQNEAHTIAFPLISYAKGFPKDIILKIAVSAITDFINLFDYDLTVYLCIPRQNAYIIDDDNSLSDFISQFEDNCELAPASNFSSDDDDTYCSLTIDFDEEWDSIQSSSSSDCLTDWLRKKDENFAVTLLRLIDKRCMTEVECYKKANVSKKTFWKINNDRKYRPSKNTVLAFAIALELTLEETEQLLKTVGFALSHSNTADMIIEYYIRKGNYNIHEINAALFKYDQECLGC